MPVGADGGSLRRERVGDGGDGGSGAELGAGPLDGGEVVGVVEPPVVGVEHDAGGQATLAREPVVQDVGGVLRLDAGDALAVVELAAGAALQGHDGDGGHQPQAEHPEGVPGADAAESVEKCTHGILLGLGPAASGDDLTIQECADLWPRWG